jgi:uncharacterized protein with GYD domain
MPGVRRLISPPIRTAAFIVFAPGGVVPIIVSIIVSIAGVHRSEPLDAIDVTAVREAEQCAAHDFASSVEADEDIAPHKFAVDLDVDRRIVLFAVLRIFGEIEAAPVFAEDAWLSIAKAKYDNADVPPLIRLNDDPDDLVFLDFNVVPSAKEIRRFPIKRVARIRLCGARAQ